MIKLIRDYYLAADKSSYTVGKAEESRSKRFFKPGSRYYPTLASAVAGTAEIALRDKIAQPAVPVVSPVPRQYG